MIRAAMLSPNLSIGGAERWVATLIAYSDPSRLRWTGVALSGWGGLDPHLCDEVAAHAPIFAENKIERTLTRGLPTPAAASLDCERFLRRCGGMQAAVRKACDGADVLVVWGSHKYRNYLAEKGMPGEFVMVSHSSHHRPVAIPPVSYCRTHLAAVSRAACRPVTFEGNDPAAVVHNGVDLERLHPSEDNMDGRWIRDSWGARDDQHVVGYIGRQTAEKNPAAAVQAVEALGKDWLAVYYGNTPQGHRPPKGSVLREARFGDLKANAHKYPFVRFYDPVMEVGDVYAGLDVLMLASRTEAFSLTLIEAWLTETPVVATPVGCLPELQEKYGELVVEVPMNPTPEQLAEACQKAVVHDTLPCVARAYELARKQFTAEAMVERWTTYLEGILAEKMRRRAPTRLDL
jgi:glycosyltransferase involved in cell wall biosynthesis